VASILFMRNMERLVAATDTVRRLELGLEAALHMQNLSHQMDAAQADLFLGEDLTTIERFDAAQSAMRRLRLRLADVVETDEERMLLWESRRLEAKIHSDFHTRFVPAVMDEDWAKIRGARRETIQPLDRIIEISERLARGIQGRIDGAVSHAENVRREAVRNSALLLGTAVLLALAVALIVSRSLIGPIQKLIAGTEAVAKGQLQQQIDIRRRDEFGRLAESFNRMTADLREQQDRLVQAQKMASLGQLAAGVAHEINNPIGVILGYAGMLRNRDLDETAREDVATIEEEARQCKRIVEDLLNLSRPVITAEEAVDVKTTLQEAAARVEHLDAEGRVRVRCDLPEGPLWVRGERDKLRQVFDNLSRNAVEAMPEGGALTFVARADSAVGEIVLEISDTGMGMSLEQCARAFDPFFSTKSNGTGLGLAIVFNIVRAHQGHISVRSEKGEGATFTISLPAAPPEAS